MMMQIKSIEQRIPNMVKRLLDIWESSVTKTHTFLKESDIVAIKSEVEQGLDAIAYLYGYFDDNGALQGFIGLENHKIEMLFIDANSRGKGVGRQLLDFALDDLDAKYVDVNEQNGQGVGFYKHMGFVEMSRSDVDEQGRPFPILHLEIER